MSVASGPKMTVREEVAANVLESSIASAEKSELKEAEMREGLDAMPNYVEPEEGHRCACCQQSLGTLVWWFGVVVAYVSAQAYARGLDNMAALSVHFDSIISPASLAELLLEGLKPYGDATRLHLPIPVECLNVCGGTLFLYVFILETDAFSLNPLFSSLAGKIMLW